MKKKYSSTTTTLNSIMGLIRDGFLSLLLKIQRKERWPIDKQLEAVHSALSGLMPFYVVIVTIYGIGYLVDGKQRITALKKFMDCEEGMRFPNNKDLYVEYEKVEEGKKVKTIKFNLKGCGYNDLPDELKKIFLNATVIETSYDNLTDEEIVELFKRINSGMPLNSSEGYRTLLYKYNKKALNHLDNICDKYKEFFLKFISDKSLKAGDDLLILLRALCLIKSEEDSTGIDKSNIIKTIKNINNNDIKKLEYIIKTMISAKTKIDNSKIGSSKALPYIMVEMKYASNIEKYFEAINEFYSDTYDTERGILYNKYRNSTTSIRCVNHRRKIFRNIAKESNIGMYYKDEWDTKKKECEIKNINVNVTTVIG